MWRGGKGTSMNDFASLSHNRLPLMLALASLAIFGMFGCSTTPPKKQALDTAAITVVQAEIKRQVGIYMQAVASEPAVHGDPKDFWCGTGNINFDISTVKAELTTTIETIRNAGITAKIPIHAVTIDPSIGASTDVTNTQVLDYNLWPLDFGRQSLPKSMPTPEEKQSAPIAQVLLSLREALINSAKRTDPNKPQPCFTDYNPDKPAADAGNTFKLGLSFVNDVTKKFEISVWVLDLTAGTETKGTTGNTLTVSFVQRDLAKIQRARDAVDTECKYPKKETDTTCKDAVAEFRKAQGDTGVSARN
jgi:hypothetical protein